MKTKEQSPNHESTLRDRPALIDIGGFIFKISPNNPNNPDNPDKKVYHQDQREFDDYLKPGPDGKLPPSPYLKK